MSEMHSRIVEFKLYNISNFNKICWRLIPLSKSFLLILGSWRWVEGDEETLLRKPIWASRANEIVT